MIGKPISEPVSAVSRMPFSTDGNIFLRDVAALDLVDEDEARAALAGNDADLDLAELARAARLLLVGVGQVDRLREIFAIGDLRSADIGLDLELALHAVDQDLEVELAHPLDDRLARFMVGGDAERRILARQAVERDAHLLLVGLGLGLDRDLDDRVGEFHPLEDDRRVGRAQRVAGGGVLEARQSDDVAGVGDLDVLAVVGMHQQHAADLFLLVLDRVRAPATRSRACPNRCARRSACRRTGRS